MKKEPLYDYVIDDIASKYVYANIALFDIGLDAEAFFQKFIKRAGGNYSKIIKMTAYPADFLNVSTSTIFNVITAFNILPKIQSSDLEAFVKKVYAMLGTGGKFYCVTKKENSVDAEELYVNMFLKNGFIVDTRKEIDDGYFLNSVLVFRKI